MGLTNFPNGVTSFGVPIIGSTNQIPATTGNYWFVSSTTGSNGNDGKTPTTPFATVAYAISKSAASDVIVMMPGHAETIATAGGWTPIAGTAIVGLGWGGYKPVIKLSATASSILVSAANVTFQNMRTTVSVSEVVKVFSVTGNDCTINGVDFIEDLTNNYTCISWLVSTATANRISVLNCRHQSTTTPTGTAGWITFVGGDGHNVVGNQITIARANNAAAYVVGGLTTAATNMVIQCNLLGSMTSGTNLIACSLYSGSTGLVSDNRGFNLGKTAIAGGFALASATGFLNYTTHTANKCGLLDPVVDS